MNESWRLRGCPRTEAGEAVVGLSAGPAEGRACAVRPRGRRPAEAPEVAIMFTDIEGSAEMNERLGDRRWIELLRRHNAIVRRLVGRHGGTLVKSQGDGFMVVFAGAGEAVACAVAIQAGIAALPGVRVRIGIHGGRALRDGDDFVGRTVILAARIAAAARGGEILVSSTVRLQAAEFSFGGSQEMVMKGLDGVHHVHRVAHEERRVS